MEEIQSLFEKSGYKTTLSNSKGNEWSGTVPSGIKIEGYINSDKVTVYPIYGGKK